MFRNGKQRVVRAEVFKHLHFLELSSDVFRLLLALRNWSDDDGNVDLDMVDFSKKCPLMFPQPSPETLNSWIEVLVEAGHLHVYEISGHAYASIDGFDDETAPLYANKPRNKKDVADWRNPVPEEADNAQDRETASDDVVRPHRRIPKRPLRDRSKNSIGSGTPVPAVDWDDIEETDRKAPQKRSISRKKVRPRKKGLAREELTSTERPQRRKSVRRSSSPLVIKNRVLARNAETPSKRSKDHDPRTSTPAAKKTRQQVTERVQTSRPKELDDDWEDNLSAHQLREMFRNKMDRTPGRNLKGFNPPQEVKTAAPSRRNRRRSLTSTTR